MTSPAAIPPPEAPESPISEAPRSGYLRARRRVYELLMSPELESELERYLRAGLTILVLANVAMVVLETVPSVHARFHPHFHLAEEISSVLFSVEYLLRAWCTVEDPRYRRPILGRLRWMITFLALVDLVAILPFVLPRLITIDLSFVRALRLVRLVRVLKLGRYSASLNMYSRIFIEKREELVVSIGLLAMLLLVASSVMYFLEHDAQPHAFSSIPASMWWGIVTLTTIGYGDIVPVTAWGRVFGGVIAVIGVGLVALPSAILVGGIMEEMDVKRKRRMKTQLDASVTRQTASAQIDARCPHCGEPL